MSSVWMVNTYALSETAETHTQSTNLYIKKILKIYLVYKIAHKKDNSGKHAKFQDG